MAISVTAANTKLYRTANGWVKVVYDTGQRDAEDKPITVQCHLTRAAIELSAGVLLPKARIKTIVQAALNEVAPPADMELAAL